jgi:hypothetical protein
MVYLASEQPLTAAPWNEKAPGFHITDLAPDERRVQSQFTKPFIVYAGSHDGCGCGFQCGEHPDESYEDGELEKRRRTLAAFSLRFWTLSSRESEASMCSLVGTVIRANHR